MNAFLDSCTARAFRPDECLVTRRAAPLRRVFLALDSELRHEVRAMITGVANVEIVCTTLASLHPENASQQVGCVVASLTSGRPEVASLPRLFSEQSSLLKFVFLAMQPEIGTAIAASRNGASDTLVWPLERNSLGQAVEVACTASSREYEKRMQSMDARLQLSQLTDPEREVIDLMLKGEPNKKIASKLDISLRTVEKRRKDIFSKLRTRNLADIVTLIHVANLNLVDASAVESHGIPKPHFCDRL